MLNISDISICKYPYLTKKKKSGYNTLEYIGKPFF